MNNQDTPQQPRPGWYPVDDGQRTRYWDGAQWTDQHGLPAGGPTPQTAGQPVVATQAVQAGPSRSKGPWYRRGWVVGLAALVLGLVIGSAAGASTDPKDSSEYKEVSGDLGDAREQLAATEAELDDVAGGLPAREEAVAEAEAALAEREEDVQAAENDVARREKAVSKTEKKIEDSMYEPGTYLVPDEAPPGRYRTVEEISYCYMSQDKGSNIINNMGEDAGRPIFTVISSPGSTFTIGSECGTVQKID